MDLHGIQGKSRISKTPEAVIVYSDKGVNGVSQTYHKLEEGRLEQGNGDTRSGSIN